MIETNIRPKSYVNRPKNVAMNQLLLHLRGYVGPKNNLHQQQRLTKIQHRNINGNGNK